MIPYSKQSVNSEDLEALKEALFSSHLTQGQRVSEFESLVAARAGAPYALALNSATSALYCAYSALGIGRDDEVITTPISFVATTNMLLALGAKPIFCDILPNGNIDPNKIESLITPRTKAIVSVDYAGQSVAVDSIAHIAQKHGLLWISDSSHAFGARVDNKPVGSFADATIFSFHAIKPITTAEGGAVVFKDAKAHQKAQLLHSHGVQKRVLWNSEVEFLGFNFRLNELGAALGISQYKRLDSFIAKREAIAQLYDSLFANSPYCTTLERDSRLYSTHHLYPVFLSRALWCSKESLFMQLHEKGIGVQVHYKPINSYALYGADSSTTPVAHDFYLAELSLPCHQEMTEDQAVEIAKTFNALCAERGADARAT